MKRAPDTTACNSHHATQIEILRTQTGKSSAPHERWKTDSLTMQYPIAKSHQE
jgi:hypothetical protein